MGCDIHVHLEKHDGQRWVQRKADPQLSERNYLAFAALAGVRNSFGLTPISEQRGLPDDVSMEVALESQEWEYDAHSRSWLTLQDVLAFDWTTHIEFAGMCSGPEVWDWNRWRKREGLGPKSYSGEVWPGPGGKIISWDEMTESLKKIVDEVEASDVENRWAAEKNAVEEQLGRQWCRVNWSTPLWRSMPDYFACLVANLLKVSDGDPSSARIVFWFDN